MPYAKKAAELFLSLTRIQRTFLVAFVFRVMYGIFATRIPTPPGYLLIRLLFIVIALIFLVTSFPSLMRRLLWRVRHRLLVTWIFVGVVPIVLVAMLVTEGLYFLLGQTVGYMTSTEIERQSKAFENLTSTVVSNLRFRSSNETARNIAESLVSQASDLRKSPIGAVVRRSGQVVAVPTDEVIKDIPNWLTSNFTGLVKDEKGDQYFLASYAIRGDSEPKTEVFLYERLPEQFFQKLLPGVATIVPGQGSARAGGIEINRTDKPKSGVTFNSGQSDPDFKGAAPPPGRGRWDFAISWFVLMPSRNVLDGKNDDESLAIVSTRLSLVMSRLFSTLGGVGRAFLLIMIATGILFLIVELVSVLLSAKLTRSITRAVADLYEGTRRIQSGDFSHRIPLRKNKDQLSELAGSFNSMTERIQDLIVEVKEKERLENELSIARDVQSQLFPKEVPELKHLQIWGGCQPARTVSGDYYDFVGLDSHHAALAIGDISGKGISAALLMAHIQSALRSQLMYKNGFNEALSSPASILSILNDHLYVSSPPEKYATFFLGLYSEDKSELIYCNAGHLAPMIVRGNDVMRLPGEGFPVGLFPGVQFEQQAFRLEPGDLFVGFTDGVTETPNARNEEYGDGRLKDLLIRLAGRPLDEIAKEIGSTVDEWAGQAERHDDTTLLLARQL